jgi:5'-nucleotidase
MQKLRGGYIMSNRRGFLKQMLAGSAAMMAFPAYAENKNAEKITILHTNDIHSRIEPFSVNDTKYANLGGLSRLSTMVEDVRNTEKNVILLDAGDIFQGTPYFNLFGGEVEFKLMSNMKYDASTIGNHDFDNGIDGLVDQLPNAAFPFINCNYDFNNSDLNGRVQPYKIMDKSGVRIGILGVGIELEGLVDKKNYGNIIYLDPIENANRVAEYLKKDKNCDLVICLSHLGYKYDEQNIVSDIHLAQNSKNIDLIIGGHTHTFFEKPIKIKNKEKKKILINQVGWAGINLGRIDFYIDKLSGDSEISGINLIVNSLV